MVLEEPGKITPEGVRGKRYSPLTREMYGATSDGTLYACVARMIVRPEGSLLTRPKEIYCDWYGTDIQE
jgi:hypothetical protein